MNNQFNSKIAINLALLLVLFLFNTVPAQQAEEVPGLIEVKFKKGAVTKLDKKLNLESIRNSGLKNYLSNINFQDCRKIFPNVNENDTIGINSEGKTFRKKDLSRWYIIKFDNKNNIDSVRKKLLNGNDIEYACPVVKWNVETDPNDPYYVQGYQTGLKNGTTGRDIHVYDAWNYNTGRSDVKIAVVDAGVDYTHPDLDPGNRSRVIAGYDFADDDNDPMDDIPSQYKAASHGTSVAGVIGAITNNGTGIAGIMQNVKIIPIKVFGTSGPWWDPFSWDPNSSYDPWIANGINYAASNGAKVINLSLGGPGLPGWANILIGNPVGEATYNTYHQGVLLVAGAGNNGSNAPFYPADFVGVMSVAAVDNTDSRASFSNYGSFISVCAPGYYYQNYSTKRGNSYGYFEGTSCSAPMVSGSAGLIISEALDKGISLTNDDVKHLLETSADKVPGMQGQNWSQYYGYGRINVGKALERLNPPYTVTTQTVYNSNGQLVWDSHAHQFYDNAGLATGNYYGVKQYKVSGHITYPNSYASIPNVWIRERECRGWSVANPNMELPWVKIINVTASGFDYETYFYWLGYDEIGQEINKYWPGNSNSLQAKITYTAVGIPSMISTNTTLSGTHTFDGTLSVSNGATLTVASGANITFNGSASLVVNSGASLVVNPGATINFTTGSLTINGTMTANGSSGQITFNSTGTSKWGGINLQSTASSNSVIKYCNITNANQGIYVGLANNYLPNFPTIEYNTISNCNDGIYLYNSEGSSSTPLRFNTITNSINGIRFEGLAGYSNYVWITDNTLTSNESGMVFRYAHPRVYRNKSTCNSYGVKVENYSYPKFAETQLSASGLNRFSDNAVINLYANNHVNVWTGQLNEVDEGRYGGYNTFGSPADAENIWSPLFIQSNNYSTVMANYSYFGSYPPVSWKIERDATSSIDYTAYISWDPAPGASCSQIAKSSNNGSGTNSAAGFNTINDSSNYHISGFATKGVNRSMPSVLLYFGMHHYLANKPAAAARVFYNIINTYPDSSQAVFALDLLARMLYESKADTIFSFINNFEERFGQKVHSKSYALYEASLPLAAGSLFRQNNPNGAFAVFDKIVNKFPKSENAKFSIYNKLAYCINVENSLSKAKSHYNQLESKFPDDPLLVDALILLGEDPAELLNRIRLNNEKIAQNKRNKIQKSDVDELIVDDFALEQNYPNPFNPSTIIQYQIPIDGNVKLIIYDLLGSEVAELVNKEQTKGIYRIIYDIDSGKKLSSGVYYYVIEVKGSNGKNFRDVKKMMILK